MEKTTGINRAQFLAGAAAVGAAALLPAGRADAKGRRHGLTRHGVVYTVGEGETPATAWNAARMRADVRAIRDDLHADTLDVTGDGFERLTATAAEAAERGLHVWLQPTLGDVPRRDILDHLAECGRFAERLRRQGASVELSVGCEFWLFVPGILPGDTVLERVENRMKGNFDPVRMQRELDRFTAKAAEVGRSVFHGRLSYAAAQDDEVDWNLFDVVGIDYYSSFRRPRDYVRELRQYLRWGKPVAITEFGTCTFVGAPEAGGMGWNIVDYDKNPRRSGETSSAASTPRPSISPNSWTSSSRWASTRRWPSSSSPPTPPTAPTTPATTSTWRATASPRRSRTAPTTRVRTGTGNRRRRSTRWPAGTEGALTRSRGPRPAACPWPGSGTRSRPRTRCRCRGRRHGRWSRW